MSDYVELHARSAFSFLRGASAAGAIGGSGRRPGNASPGACAIAMGFMARRDSLAAREGGIRPIVGAELTMEDQTSCRCWSNRGRGYQNLCQLLTRAHLRNEKGKAACAGTNCRNSPKVWSR